METPDPDCLSCERYFVTYEGTWPHGCRAFALKSKKLPARLVRESSGQPCAAFSPRPTPPGGERPAAESR